MYDIIVVGGGLVGSSAALALTKANPQLRIALIESSQPNFDYEGFDNKIYAISPKNLAELSKLTDALDYTRVGTIEQMIVAGDNNSVIKLNARDGYESYLSKIVEYRNLQKALLDEIHLCNKIDVIYTKLKNQLINSADSVTVYDENGTSLQSKWLIAADGANSFIRNQCEIKVEHINYFQHGVVANFQCEKPHQNIAYQWFLDSGILAFLPLPDNNISIVYSTDNYEQMLNYSDVEFAEYIAKLSGYKLGKLITSTKAVAFPLRLNLVSKLFDNSVIFIGDAAHTIHPLAGQGVNLGFGDVWELVKLFKSSTDIAATDLNKYAAVRMNEVRSMQITCHMLNRLFSNQNNMVKFMRNFGLNFINNSKLVKKQLIRHAINY